VRETVGFIAYDPLGFMEVKGYRTISDPRYDYGLAVMKILCTILANHAREVFMKCRSRIVDDRMIERAEWRV
jgi:hypothetical protein